MTAQFLWLQPLQRQVIYHFFMRLLVYILHFSRLIFVASEINTTTFSEVGTWYDLQPGMYGVLVKDDNCIVKVMDIEVGQPSGFSIFMVV